MTNRTASVDNVGALVRRLLAGLLCLAGCTVSDAVVRMADASAGADVSIGALPDVDATLSASRPDTLDSGAPSPLTPADAVSSAGADGGTCGNGTCESGETSESCCRDCGCAGGSVCDRNLCITPIAITAGGNHTCVLLQEGTAECWGGNQFGELGGGFSKNPGNAAPVRVSGLNGAKAIAAGGTFTCGLMGDKTVSCWGSNSSGQLGTGNTLQSSSPVPVSNLSGVTAIAAGYDYACAVAGGRVKCWGNNSAGQLGDGTTETSLVPVDVLGIDSAEKLAAGYASTCAIVSDQTDQTILCWGDNSDNQLGTSKSASPGVPVAVPGLTNVVGIAASDDQNPTIPSGSVDGSFCALLGSGAVKCWGANYLWDLGAGSAGSTSMRPLSPAGLLTASTVAVGGEFACAVLTAGQVNCWGNNGTGQVGNKEANQPSLPVEVTGLTTAVSVATGYQHACVLLRDGSARCWGDNGRFQLGNDQMPSSYVPVDVFDPVQK